MVRSWERSALTRGDDNSMCAGLAVSPCVYAASRMSNAYERRCRGSCLASHCRCVCKDERPANHVSAGYDTGVISVALPILSDDLGHVLSHVESEWVTASLSVGALVGALGGGALCDIWGRKLVLMIGDAWFVVGAVVVCSSYSVPQMIVRSCPTPPSAPRSHAAADRTSLSWLRCRDRLDGGASLHRRSQPDAIPCGIDLGSVNRDHCWVRCSGCRTRSALSPPLCSQLVSYALGIPLSFDQGWRAMFGIAIAPALLQAVLIHWGCPESPRYELLKGKDENARSTIAFIYKTEPNSRFLDLKLASLREVIEIGQRFREQYNYIAQLGYIARNSESRLRLCDRGAPDRVCQATSCDRPSPPSVSAFSSNFPGSTRSCTVSHSFATATPPC